MAHRMCPKPGLSQCYDPVQNAGSDLREGKPTGIAPEDHFRASQARLTPWEPPAKRDSPVQEEIATAVLDKDAVGWAIQVLPVLGKQNRQPSTKRIGAS